MAKNLIFRDGDQLSVVCTQPASPVSGDPVLFGDQPGVALTDKRADNTTSVKFSGVIEVSVKGIDGSGNSAVAVGDKLYYSSADTPKVNKKAATVAFGTAMATVGSGSTATIRVRIGK